LKLRMFKTERGQKSIRRVRGEGPEARFVEKMSLYQIGHELRDARKNTHLDLYKTIFRT